MIKNEYKMGNYVYNADIIRKRVGDYNKSMEGALKRKLWYKNNKDRMKEWQKIYRLKKTDYAKKNGLCLICFKRPVMDYYKSCEYCLNRRNENKLKHMEAIYNESKINRRNRA